MLDIHDTMRYNLHMSELEGEQFNKFCADMGGIKLYTFQLATEDFSRLYIDGGSVVYDPYDDLNQLATVVDYIRKKYLWSCQAVGDIDGIVEVVNTQWFNVYRSTLTGTNLIDALRTFIWAVMMDLAFSPTSRTDDV